MTSPSRVPRKPTPLVSRSLDDDEKVTEAVVDAFLAAGVDVFGQEQTLHDQIDVDALDAYDWASDHALVVSFSAWGHRAEVTSERVALYEGVDDPTGVFEEL